MSDCAAATLAQSADSPASQFKFARDPKWIEALRRANYCAYFWREKGVAMHCKRSRLDDDIHTIFDEADDSRVEIVA